MYHRTTRKYQPVSRSQQGAALIIALILLTIITLLSVSAMQSTNLDTRIAINHQFKELSFQAAENALAIVTAPEPAVNMPNTSAGQTADNVEFFHQDHTTDRPEVNADLTMGYVCMLAQGQAVSESDCDAGILASGFPINSGFIQYTATATGSVGESRTETTNRSDVILFTR